MSDTKPLLVTGTVLRRDTPAEAEQAAERLRTAGYRDVRVEGSAVIGTLEVLDEATAALIRAGSRSGYSVGARTSANT